MDESYHNLLAAGVEKKMRDLGVSIMEDIVRRIQKAGTITEAADWQIQRLIILGNSLEDIRALISKALGGNEEMVRQLYDEVIAREYTGMKEIYEATGKPFIPYEQNQELQQLVDAMVQQSTEELFNITKSTGFMVDTGNGSKVFTPLSEIYNSYLDDAITGMVGGAYDYSTLTRKMVNQMTASGLRTDHQFKDGGSDYGIDYASGHHNRIDVAARRALLTGFGQVARHVTDLNAQRLSTNYFEVSWHGGARPSHAVWQGRVFSKEELRSVCGLGQGGGLNGWNCHHTYYPFIPGVSQRQYSDEWLEQKAAEEAETVKWRGKEYNAYQATQRQRQLETMMRARRERVQLLRQSGADPETITEYQCKYQATLQEYRAFSERMKLPTQMERVYTGRTPGRISPSPQKFAAWQAGQINRAKERQEERRRKDMDAASSARESSRRTKEGAEAVQWSVIRSKEYTTRFSGVTGNAKADELAAQRARNMLAHRDGKTTEEIYAISQTTGKDVAKITNQETPFGIQRDQKFMDDVARAEARGEKLLMLHNHPHGSPPSVADINELLSHKAAAGLTIGHDGSIYYYTGPSREIQAIDEMVAIRHSKDYNGIERDEEVLKRLAEDFGFTFKKL